MTKQEAQVLEDGYVAVQVKLTPHQKEQLKAGVQMLQEINHIEGSKTKYLQTDFIRDAIAEKLEALGIDFSGNPSRGGYRP